MQSISSHLDVFDSFWIDSVKGEKKSSCVLLRVNHFPRITFKGAILSPIFILDSFSKMRWCNYGFIPRSLFSSMDLHICFVAVQCHSCHNSCVMQFEIGYCDVFCITLSAKNCSSNQEFCDCLFLFCEECHFDRICTLLSVI